MGRSADEAFWMVLVSDIEDGLALGDELGRLAVVNRGGREQLEPGVVMLVVIPGKELLTETTCILDGAESIRILRSIFQGLKMSLREWIVIGDMRTAVGFHDTQVG